MCFCHHYNFGQEYIVLFFHISYICHQKKATFALPSLRLIVSELIVRLERTKANLHKYKLDKLVLPFCRTNIFLCILGQIFYFLPAAALNNFADRG